MSKRSIFLAVLLLTLQTAAQEPAAAQTNGPVVHFGEISTLHSKILGEDRPYWIYLPRSYKPTPDHAPQKYPVLYLLDGESQFSFASELVQFMSDSLQIPELIVVAIPNTDRMRDLTPTHNPSDASSGGGELFEKFLSEELIPKIDTQLRTAPYRILAGHSLGGVLVADAFLRQRNVFHGYIAVDPALWWDHEIIIQRAREFPKTNSSPKAFFIATANHPHSLVDTNSSIKAASERFTSALRTNTPSTIHIGYHYFENEDHGSSRLPGLHDGLLFIFENYKSTNFYALDQPSLIGDHFRTLSNRLGYDVQPPEAFVDQIAFGLLSAHEIDKAIDCFKLNATNYPHSAQVYKNLADAYLAKGDKDSAIQNYDEALALNPNMTSAEEALKKLK